MTNQKKRYEPELGQALFGQPHKKYEVPTYVEAALVLLSSELGRIQWNRLQKLFNPFDNTGDSYNGQNFKVYAYSWSGDQPYNFRWRDLEISWYKYLGRGMSMNRETTPDEIAEMLEECLRELTDKEVDYEQ